LIKPKAFIVHTERDKNTLTNIGVESDKIFVIPHGAYSFFKKYDTPTDEENAVLFFGYIQENKGLEYLLKSMPIVHKELSDVKLIIAGEGDISKYSKLFDTIDKSKLEIYNEFIPNELVNKLLHRARVVVIPYSFHRGHSGIISVALAFGKPIITTNVGDLPNMVENGKEALIVHPKDPESLANAILKILSDTELRKKMSKYALEKSYELSWDNIAKKHIKVYEKVVGV